MFIYTRRGNLADIKLKKIQNENSGINNPINYYLHQISLFKLLNRNEEVELAKRIEKGDPQAKKEMTANF